MKFIDDRTPEQRKTHHVLWGGTDTFLSGWGKAEGGPSRNRFPANDLPPGFDSPRASAQKNPKVYNPEPSHPTIRPADRKTHDAMREIATTLNLKEYCPYLKTFFHE